MKINLPFNRVMTISKRGISYVKDGQLVGFNDWRNRVGFDTSTPILEQVYFTIASEFAKLDLRHVIATHSNFTHIHDTLDYLVSERPNKWQSKYDFLFTMAYQMYKYGNAIALIERDERGHVLSIVPQNVNDYLFGCGYKTDEEGVVWYKIKHKKNEQIEFVREDNILHMRLNPNNIFMGDLADLSMANVLVKVVNKSFNALLTKLDATGSIKGVVKVGSASQGFSNLSLANESNKEAKQRELVERIKSSDGVLVLDAGEEWQSLSSPFESVSSEDIDKYISLILQFYGVSKRVVDGSASFEEMEIFFSSRIVPIMERFIQEANYKIFDSNSLTRGHRIEYYRNPFEYVPIDKAIDIAYKSIQDTTTNERRRMIYKLAPIEDGDKVMYNKNFEEVGKDD